MFIALYQLLVRFQIAEFIKLFSREYVVVVEVEVRTEHIHPKGRETHGFHVSCRVVYENNFMGTLIFPKHWPKKKKRT